MIQHSSCLQHFSSPWCLSLGSAGSSLTHFRPGYFLTCNEIQNCVLHLTISLNHLAVPVLAQCNNERVSQQKHLSDERKLILSFWSSETRKLLIRRRCPCLNSEYVHMLAHSVKKMYIKMRYCNHKAAQRQGEAGKALLWVNK